MAKKTWQARIHPHKHTRARRVKGLSKPGTTLYGLRAHINKKEKKKKKSDKKFQTAARPRGKKKKKKNR